MRDFFKDELKQLHLTTGLQQYFKLSQMPDFNDQFKKLLDMLERECAKFPLIPEEDKKKIIQACMIEDPEFQGFNPKILWKWFNIANRKYLPNPNQFDEKAAEPVNHSPEEQAKIDALLEDWKKQLGGIGEKPQFVGLDQDIEQIKREDQERQEGRKAIPYKTPTHEEVRARELHDLWIRENFDKYTAKKLPGWVDEETWLASVALPATQEENKIE